MLRYEDESSPSSPHQALFCGRGDAEGSSEGSHETGDSGRYSHDETEMTHLSSGRNTRPPSPRGAEDSGGGSEGWPDLAVEIGDIVTETARCHRQPPSEPLQVELSL